MKSIVMIGGGIQQKYAVTKLQKNGYKVIVTDKNPNSETSKLADYFINASATEVKKISTWILNHKSKLNIKGIFTLINYAYETSVIAKSCNLPSLEPNLVLESDDKLLMKNKFLENEIPTAKFLSISNFKELEEGIKKIGLPAFLKATDAFGGRGIEEISNNDEIKIKWDRVTKVVSSGSIILEEKLDGEFLDLQGFLHNGNFFRAGDCQSWFTENLPMIGKINPIETLNIAPAQNFSDVIDDAYRLLEKTAISLGIKWGPIGGDLIRTKEGLKIIEIAARLHGPNGTLWLFPLIGLEPLLFLAQMVCNESLKKGFLETETNRVSLCKVFTGKPGIVKKIKIPNHKNIVGFNIYSKINESYNLDSPYAGLATVFVKTNTLDEAKQALKEIEIDFEIEINNNS